MSSNKINRQQAIEIIEKEFNERTLGVTGQYLEIHRPVYIDRKLKVDHIDYHAEGGYIIAYLPVADERFYFAVYVNPLTKEVTNVETEAYYQFYFKATSENLSVEELKSMTGLIPAECWNRGDPAKNGKLNHRFSCCKFFPGPQPDTFENKLKKLLDLLEQDPNGIRKLVDHANGYIQVAMDSHNANGMIGRYSIDTDDIRRMNILKLSVNIDFYVGGNSFIS